MIEPNSTVLYSNAYLFNNTTTSEVVTPILNYSQNDIHEVYPIRDSLKLVIPLTILYSVIFVSGMLGNIITCIVIARNRTMHTATNYYLFSLAISDLLLLISGMPLEIYGMWYRYPFPFGEPICILQGFAAETSANATVLTITAFTAERYIAICHPFLSHTMSKLSRAIKFILGIWIFAMGLAVPQILDLGLTRPYDTCGIKNDLRKHVFTISSIICFVFPMTVITVFYVLIGLQLRRSKIVGRATTANGNSIKLKTKYRIPSHKNTLLTIDRTGKANTTISPASSHGAMEVVYTSNGNQEIGNQPISNNAYDEGRKNYSQKGFMGTRHVVNMLVAVVVAFFVCWAPHHAQRLFAMNADPDRYGEIYEVLTHISGVLYFVSTCINPFLYNIMSHKFREAFKGTCATCIYGREYKGCGSKGSLSRNISQRSTSHSAHTCSSVCSSYIRQTENTAYILDQDFALLKCNTKRPLTVKFKKAPRTLNLAMNSHQQLQQQKELNLAELETYYRKTNLLNRQHLDSKRMLSGDTFYGTINNELRNDYSVFTMANCKVDFDDIPPKSFSTNTPSRRHNDDDMEFHSEICRSFCYPGSKRDTTSNMNTSPYDSPELTANSRKLEESLQNILKDLVKTDSTSNGNLNTSTQVSKGIVKGMSKSRSVTSLLAIRSKKSNKYGKQIELKEPF